VAYDSLSGTAVSNSIAPSDSVGEAPPSIEHCTWSDIENARTILRS
jgi:hypothetical protein